jgi:hypothetical protein
MLAPRASGAFVCLRCELQRVRPRLPALPRRTAAHVNFSAAARRWDAFGDTAQGEPPRPRPRLSEHPLGRLSKRKGKKSHRATTARLGGVKTLGDDAEILVLEEFDGGPPEEESAEPEIVSATPQEDINIVESLREESNPVSTKEIVEQIESLRPRHFISTPPSPDDAIPSTEPEGPAVEQANADPGTAPEQQHADTDEPHYIGQTAYVKLSRTLLRSFTGSQLSQYYSIKKGVKRTKVSKEVIAGLKELQSQAQRPSERSDWHPGTTQIDLRLPGLDFHRVQRKPVQKHLLVDQILRDLWKLVLLEEIEAAGELELSLKPWQLTLLTSGSDMTPLDRIGQDRRAKIEVHWPHNVVRITADKNTAEYAADDIEQLLRSVATKTFKLQPWHAYMTSDATANPLIAAVPETSLKAVAAMTGTTVQAAGPHAYLIRAFDRTAVEEAGRALLRLLPLKGTSASTMDSTRRDSAQRESYLAPVSVSKTLLDFPMRHLAVGRWSVPVTQKPASSVANEDELDDAYAQISNMLVSKSTSSPIPPKERQAGLHAWAFAPEDQLLARFGQLLYPLNNDMTPSTLVPSFVPSLPGLANLVLDNDFEMGRGLDISPILEYRFLAAPGQHEFLKKDQQYPSLRVQFAHNEKTKQHYLRSIRLEMDERIHDVLLPGNSLDLRFYKRTRLRMFADKSDTVEKFAKAVVDNIHSGGKLQAPNLKIEIPKWTIPGHPYAHLGGTQGVTYLFTGIRFRQNVQARLGDTEVSISSTQSGKLGSKSVAMAAICDALPTHYTARDLAQGIEDTPKDGEEDGLRRFVAGCFKIVDKITKATGSKAPSTEKARSQTSERKIRRAQQHAAPRDNGEMKEGAEQVSAPADGEMAEQQGTRLSAQDLQDLNMSSFLGGDDGPTEQGLAREDTQDGLSHHAEVRQSEQQELHQPGREA